MASHQRVESKGLICVVLALFFGLSSVVANAQIEEIIVTAQKREQSIQDVSISVTALTGDMISDFGFQDTLEIFNQIPNVDADQHSYFGTLTIRGNSTLNSMLAGEGTVGMYFDEVYRPQAYYGGNNMLDLERVEVLRGPQGTLFGRNSTGGLVHFISRKPADEFEAYATFEYGSYDTRILEAAVSGPLTDRVRGRVAFQYHKDDGIQDNLGPAGGKLGKTDHLTGRGQLEFDLGDRAVLLLSIEASDQDDIGKGFHHWGILDPVTLEQCEVERIRAGQCVGGGALFGLPTFSDPKQDPEEVYTELDPNNGGNRYTLETLTAIAKLTFKLTDTIDIVSITAYDSYDRFFNPDEDASATGAYGGLFQFDDHYSQDFDQFTQEIRLSGVYMGADWTAGFFYLDSDQGSTSTIRAFESVQRPDTIGKLDVKSWAVFAQVGIPLGDQFRLIGGVRYTDDDKKTDVLTAGIPGSNKLSNTNASPKIGLEWRPRDEWMIYGSISTGFRSGNFNSDLLFGNLSLLNSVDPEKVKSYEGGFKATLFDGRARVNAAVFYLDVSDKQGFAVDSVAERPVGRIISLGDVDIYGAELELFVVPAEQLEMSLGVGWLDTEIRAPASLFVRANFGTGDNAFLGDQYFLDGSGIGTGAPKWTVNGLVRYHIPLADNGNVTAQVDFSYRAATTGLGGNEVDFNEDRWVVNLRLFWRSPSERWQVEGYVENVFDEQYISNMIAFSGMDHAYGNWGLPRWFGVKVGVDF